MKLKIKPSLMASIALAMGLAGNVSAQQVDYHWTGLSGSPIWAASPNNWTIWTNSVPGVTPPVMVPSGLTGVPVAGGSSFIGNVYLDQGNGISTFVIPPGDVESPGVPPAGSPEEFNSIFGPEFGASLNVFGTLNFDWILFPVQNDPAPANRSYLNLYTNAVVTCVGAGGNGGAALGIGDSWFYQDAPYETMNMYGNASYSSPGGAGLWLGGHLNIYDNASFLVNGYVNMDVLDDQSDGTRSIVLGGGTLTLPENTINLGNSGSVTNWIARGILRAYGKGEDTNDLIITDNGANTIVTPVPLGGSLQRVYFLSLLHTNLTAGIFEQTSLVGDYPSVGGVLLSSSEPGLSPGSFPHPVYTSSNPNVVSVDTNGMVTAVAPGKAVLTAVVGSFTSTNSIAITVSPVIPAPIHRYSFASDATDSIGGANGTLNGDATITGGQLVLSGNQGSSVSLPAGILSGLDEVTIETWATFPSTINAFANLFAFGLADTTAFDPNNGLGGNYITLSPHTGGLTTQANFGQGLPGFNGERDAVSSGGVLDNQSNVHIVAVYHPLAGFEALYINGALVSSVSMFNNLIDPVACQGPTYTNGSILAYTLGTDPNNYIGQSLYAGDPGLLANIDEFRIYNVALTPAQIAADHALGASQLIGASTNVTLSVTASGGNLTIKWPTTSALVALMASPKLGPGATWTVVTGNLTTDGSGNYQMTVQESGTTQFFRLQQ